MKKSAEDKLLMFFRENSNKEFASGEIQRMSFSNKNGTLATPRSLVRRMQELCEEGKILNVGTDKGAVYKLNTGVVQPRMKQVVEQMPDNTVRITYVPC